MGFADKVKTLKAGLFTVLQSIGTPSIPTKTRADRWKEPMRANDYPALLVPYEQSKTVQWEVINEGDMTVRLEYPVFVQYALTNDKDDFPVSEQDKVDDVVGAVIDAINNESNRSQYGYDIEEVNIETERENNIIESRIVFTIVTT